MKLISQSPFTHYSLLTQAVIECFFFALLWSVTESDDSPMQVETIEDPKVTHLTLKGLDRHSHYRFYLRGRTAAGDGELIMRKGATTLDGGIKVHKRLINDSCRARLH